MGANSFLKELTPNYKGGKNKDTRVASPEGVPIQLKTVFNIDTTSDVVKCIPTEI